MKAKTKNGMTTVTAVLPTAQAVELKEYSARSGLRMAALFSRALAIGLAQLKKQATA